MVREGGMDEWRKRGEEKDRKRKGKKSERRGKIIT